MLKSNKKNIFVYLAGILFVASFLRLHGLDKIEYVFDEFHDIPTAIAYYNDPNPFSVEANSPRLENISEARLPYYITAINFFLGLPHEMKNSFLWHTRIPFALLGVLSVLMVYFLGKEIYSIPVGILSAFLLAISSFHAGFSRFAVTTGDVCLSFFFITSLLLFFKGIKKHNQKYLLASGITTGLACASKFIGVLLIPIFLIFSVFHYRSNLLPKALHINKKSLFLSILNIAASFALISVSILWHGRWFSEEFANKMLIFFLSGAFIYLSGIIIAISRIQPSFNNSEIYIIFLNIILTSIIFTFFGSTVHLKPEIFMEAVKWFDIAGYNNAIPDRSFLNIINIIIFKLGFPFNVMFFSGIIYSFGHLKDKSNLFVLISVVLYLSVLASFRWFSSFHLMPVMPLIIMLSIRELGRHYNIIKMNIIRIIFAFLVCISIGFQLYNIVKIQPFYHFDGYKWGRKFIGVNKPSFILLDGLRDSVVWIEKYIPDNSKVGFLLHYELLEQIFGKDYDKMMDRYIISNVRLYSVKENIKYSYISRKDQVYNYDYIIASTIYEEEWLKKITGLHLIHSTRHLELGLYNIYKCIK